MNMMMVRAHLQKGLKIFRDLYIARDFTHMV